ncbi:MAG: cation transporter [Sediminibacterium sp.]|nr:cation transporter [Sediminibacterium sp.]
MKNLLLLVGLFFTTTTAIYAQNPTKLKVSGNCGMCKSSIEKAAKSAGATSASWDMDAKLLTLMFDSKTSLDKIESAIAAVGYDTEHKTATKSAYDALHECCKYDRDTTAAVVPAEIKKVTLVASGLTCSMCSKAIFKALTSLEFVADVKVDIEKSMYILTFKADKKVAIDQIKLAVTDAGFGVQSLVYE